MMDAWEILTRFTITDNERALHVMSHLIEGHGWRAEISGREVDPALVDLSALYEPISQLHINQHLKDSLEALRAREERNG